MPDKIFRSTVFAASLLQHRRQKIFIADNFQHYLEAHKNLHFPHKHSFNHLVYFSKGSGTHSIDFVNFPVTAGQVYFMTPGQVHDWNFKTSPDGFIVNFSEQYINAFIPNTRYLDQFSFFLVEDRGWLAFFVRYDKNWRKNAPRQLERTNKTHENNW